MELTLRGMRPEEHKYSYTQSRQLIGQTGCVGHIRGDMGEDGNGFHPSWEDHTSHLNTPAFRAELEHTVGLLRFDPAFHGILKDRKSLAAFCFFHPELVMDDGRSYGVRADSGNHAHLIRLNPDRGEYSFYLYSYRKDRLDAHLRAAARGIRFITPDYREKFRLPDGGKLVITDRDGKSRIETCRYIDEYHLEMGGSIYHICEFAESAERGNCRVRPFSEEKAGPGKEARHAGTGR